MSDDPGIAGSVGKFFKRLVSSQTPIAPVKAPEKSLSENLDTWIIGQVNIDVNKERIERELSNLTRAKNIVDEKLKFLAQALKDSKWPVNIDRESVSSSVDARSMASRLAGDMDEAESNLSLLNKAKAINNLQAKTHTEELNSLMRHSSQQKTDRLISDTFSEYLEATKKANESKLKQVEQPTAPSKPVSSLSEEISKIEQYSEVLSRILQTHMSHVGRESRLSRYASEGKAEDILKRYGIQ